MAPAAGADVAVLRTKATQPPSGEAVGQGAIRELTASQLDLAERGESEVAVRRTARTGWRNLAWDDAPRTLTDPVPLPMGVEMWSRPWAAPRPRPAGPGRRLVRGVAHCAFQPVRTSVGRDSGRTTIGPAA
jgi:hypothetical protein